MLQEGEAALICDFAETYHIYDYRQFPAAYVAVLADGLREDARIWEIMKVKVDTNKRLLAGIYDCVNWIRWSRTKDAENDRNRPKSIYHLLFEQEKDDHKAPEGFATAEEFKNKWKEIINAHNR